MKYITNKLKNVTTLHLHLLSSPSPPQNKNKNNATIKKSTESTMGMYTGRKAGNRARSVINMLDPVPDVPVSVSAAFSRYGRMCNTLLVPPGVCGSKPPLAVWDPRFSWLTANRNTLLVPTGVCGSWPLLAVWDSRFSWAHRQPATHSISNNCKSTSTQMSKA